MFEIRRTWQRRPVLRVSLSAGRRASRRMAEQSEAGLGSVAAQARRVAGAVTALVAIGVVVGCFGAPAGVDCSRHGACSKADPCSECVDVPGCGPVRVDPIEACQQSCPLALECTLSAECPARMRCAGLVPGRIASNGTSSER